MITTYAEYTICSNCDRRLSEHGGRNECPLGAKHRTSRVTFEPLNPQPKTIGDCFNCGKPQTEESYCYGCKAIICDQCDTCATKGGTFGPHAKEVHLVF